MSRLQLILSSVCLNAAFRLQFILGRLRLYTSLRLQLILRWLGLDATTRLQFILSSLSLYSSVWLEFFFRKRLLASSFWLKFIRCCARVFVVALATDEWVSLLRLSLTQARLGKSFQERRTLSSSRVDSGNEATIQ